MKQKTSNFYLVAVYLAFFKKQFSLWLKRVKQKRILQSDKHIWKNNISNYFHQFDSILSNVSVCPCLEYCSGSLKPVLILPYNLLGLKISGLANSTLLFLVHVHVFAYKGKIFNLVSTTIKLCEKIQSVYYGPTFLKNSKLWIKFWITSYYLIFIWWHS